jgi:c-di-AMP phosphodiesterase-like protein
MEIVTMYAVLLFLVLSVIAVSQNNLLHAIYLLLLATFLKLPFVGDSD